MDLVVNFSYIQDRMRIKIILTVMLTVKGGAFTQWTALNRALKPIKRFPEVY